MAEQFVEITDPDDRGRRWRFDREFLASNWTCIWGRGCQGILDHPAEELGQGCCSVGAAMHDEDEARMTAALAAMLDPAKFQFHAEAAADGIFEGRRTNTRVVDDACIFLNRPGFAGGAGCALHIAAVDADESPTEWKPSVCWQLPVKIDWEVPRSDSELRAGGVEEIATLRGWARKDWGDEGETMAWICTEAPDAYVGDEPVIESLADELGELLGPDLYAELRDRLTEPDGDDRA